jgi:hypothetical protein
MEDALTRVVSCGSCGREWRTPRNPEPVPPLRLYAMPPDDMPAGTCPGCGLSYCVGCRKEALDEAGRFVCPDCGKSLKLTDEGLKGIIYKWAEKNVPKEPKKKKKAAVPEKAAQPEAAAVPEKAPEPEAASAEPEAVSAPEIAALEPEVSEKAPPESTA